MKGTSLGLVALACTVVLMARAADLVRPQVDPKRGAQVAANSNLAAYSIPQLAPNTNRGPEVPMAPETNPAAIPTREAKPLAAQPRNPLGMILAVLAVLLGSHFLKRWLSRPGPS